MSERPLIQPPELAGDPDAARLLLERYDFHADANAANYVRSCGPFVLRVSVEAPVRLELSVAGGRYQSWRVPLADDPLAVATEAAWFVATVIGLTPPVVGGKLITEKE